MSRYGQLLLDPNSPQFNKSVVEAISRILQIIEGNIEFGHPQHPQLDASVVQAGAGTPTTHNGTLSNILGSWVEILLDDATNLLNTNVTCTHNLGVTVLDAAQPNVRWLAWGWQHSGAGTGAGSTVSTVYTDGTVTSNAIQLRFFAAARTVTVANPLKVTLWFIPAVLGIAQP